MSLVSILKLNPPSLNKENLIKQSVPNQLVAKQIKEIQSDILEFLKKKLNNHSIVLKIEINEKFSEAPAYNTNSLFEKMKRENPALAFLQKCFALDI